MRLLAFLLWALGTVAFAQPPEAVIVAFDEARRGVPGPARLDIIDGFLETPHVTSLPRLLSALIANGGAVVQLEKQIANIEAKRDKVAATARRREEKRGVKWEKAAEQLELHDSDLRFRRRQIRDLFKECRLLRRGYRACFDKGTVEEREQHVQALLRRAGGRDPYPIRRQVLRLLSHIDDPRISQALETALTKDRDPYVRGAAADALGDRGRPESEPALILGLGDDYAVVRAAVVSSLRVVGGASAVEGLIERLPHESGRLLQDVTLALRHLTGVSYHDNVTLWREWWAKEKPRYRRARKGGKKIGRDIKKRDLLADGNGQGFYGLRFRSHALVYLIDTSGSMAEKVRGAGTTGVGSEDETKLDRAKRELIRSLKALPSGIMVNVVAYSGVLNPYAREMVKLTDGNRRAMISWARMLHANGKTNIYDALALVFDQARGKRGRPSKAMIVDTILLLTDGLPTAGRVQDSALIVSEVARMNDRSRIVIHTVGVGPDHDAELLEELSDGSQGVYIKAR